MCWRILSSCREVLPGACLRVYCFWLQGSRISFVPLDVTLQEASAFHCFHFLLSERGGKKIPSPPAQRNARKTPAVPSEALPLLVMKPHHHLNCSILKVCENCTKLIFPISLLSVAAFSGSKRASLYGNLRYSDVVWEPKNKCLREYQGASLVAQWLRICLPMQGTRVRALVWEDPTCHGATGPVSHNY